MSKCLYCGGLGCRKCQRAKIVWLPDDTNSPWVDFDGGTFEELACKLGFIRLAPDEVVVKRTTAEIARDWYRPFAARLDHTESDRAALTDLESALDGTKTNAIHGR